MRPLLLAWFLGALAFQGLIGPVQACTGTTSPPYDVHVVVTDNGTTLLDLDTGNRHVSHPCGSSRLGHPQFDGRFVTWETPGGMRGADVETGRLIEDIPAGHLWQGAVHALEGEAVVSLDLATGRETRHRAPADTLFAGAMNGVAWAYASRSDPPAARDGLHILDLVTGTWIRSGEALAGTGWPDGGVSVAAADREWIVARDDRGDLWAARAAGGGPPTPLPDDPPAGQTMASPGAMTQVDGLRAGRLYLSKATGGLGAPAGWVTWSYRLPDASDPSGGWPGATVGSRSAVFRLESGSTATTSLPQSPTEPTTVPDGRDATTPPPTSRAAGFAAIAVVAGLACAVGVVRRRLHG